MPVVSVNLPEDLLVVLDRAVQEGGYKSRSELVREALEEKLQAGDKTGTYRIILVLSDHENYPMVDQRIMQAVYRAAGDLRALYHQVLDEGRCLTVIVLREGPVAGVVTQNLRRIKGVVRIAVVKV